MIDWDIQEIKKIEQHYKKILNPNINLTYFCRHFEEIYILLTEEDEILPDILNDITYYTFNGINAKYKILSDAEKEYEKSKKLLNKRMKQRAQRQEARNKSLDEYYNFIIMELEEFIEKYPFWNELLQYKN